MARTTARLICSRHPLLLQKIATLAALSLEGKDSSRPWNSTELTFSQPNANKTFIG